MNENINYPSSDERITIPSMKVQPLKKICMTIGQLPTAYVETMSYYEMLIWFIGFLRDTVIPTVNNNGEALQEVQTIVMELQNYINDYKDTIDQEIEDFENQTNETIENFENQTNAAIESFEETVNGTVQGLEDYMNNYFDNLDVQEEINNKLDDMLEDGVLEQIIEQYLQSTAVWCFDTVNDMKQATNLVNGSYCKTLGYYSINDGGGATYKITNATSNLYHQESITSLSLYANLIVENDTINFKQLGAKENDNTYDNHTHYVEYESLCNTNNKKYKLFIPSGVWYASETQFTRVNGLIIEGCNKAMKGTEATKDYTTLKNINNSQEYYFKIGNNTDSSTIAPANIVKGYELDKLVFEGTFNNSAIVILGCEWSKIGYLHFRFIYGGHCLNISSSWEIDFDYMSFRKIYAHNSAIYFDKIYEIQNIRTNCSALYFNYLNFENMDCTCIETNKRANFVHNDFNVIQYERSFASGDGVTTLPEGVTVNDTTKLYLFKGWFDNTTINCINHYNTNKIYLNDSDNNTWYTYYSIFTDDIITTLHEDYQYNNNAISISNMLLYGNNASYIASSHFAERNSIIKINNVLQKDQGEKIYEGTGENGLILQINTMNNTSIINQQYALNCLMDKMFPQAKSTTQGSKQFELMTTSKALDISGCGLISKLIAPIPCIGVKKINLTVSLIDKTTKEEVASTMRFGYKNRTDTSYTYITNTNITAGLNRITIDLSEINYPEQYVIFATSVSLYDLIVYTINYEY